MQTRVEEGAYASKKEFLADVQLMVCCCATCHTPVLLCHLTRTHTLPRARTHTHEFHDALFAAVFFFRHILCRCTTAAFCLSTLPLIRSF
jgi:hypothetical protein